MKQLFRATFQQASSFIGFDEENSCYWRDRLPEVEEQIAIDLDKSIHADAIYFLATPSQAKDLKERGLRFRRVEK